jgi:hypothetical protein
MNAFWNSVIEIAVGVAIAMIIIGMVQKHTNFFDKFHAEDIEYNVDDLDDLDYLD